MKEVVRLANRPLGQGNAFAPSKKEWLPVVMAAASLATSLAGGAASGAANRKAAAMQRQQEAKEMDWYKRRYNEDYVDTAAGQNLVRRAKEFARENWRKAAGAQAVAGGTEAATAQAKEAGNKMMGDTIANIAATDQQRKAHVDDLHRQAEEKNTQMNMAREQQRGVNIAQTAQGASNALASMGSALMQDAGTTNLEGGRNNSHSTPLNIPQDRPDGGVVELKSGVEGISGEYDVNGLRKKMGLPT